MGRIYGNPCYGLFFITLTTGGGSVNADSKKPYKALFRDEDPAYAAIAARSRGGAVAEDF